MNLVKTGIAVGIVVGLLSLVGGFVAGIFGYDARIDAKIKTALEPVIDKMGKIDTGQEKNNDLLKQILAKVK